MWQGVKRVLKPRGVFVTTASQPFTSALVMSNPKWFKYEWIWYKKYMAGGLLAQYQPLRVAENVLVFSDKSPNYYPQMEKKPLKDIRHSPLHPKSAITFGGNGYDRHNVIRNPLSYPNNLILDYPLPHPNERNFQHPTQKPVALYEYLIRTYTQPGELVLDFCCGSGTTALAARNTGRRFIVGDTSPEYCAIAEDRLRLPFSPRAVTPANDVSDLPLFAALDTR